MHSIGIAVRPVYRDVRLGTVYPMMLQSLRRQLAVALRKAVFAFTGKSEQRPAHYEAFGPSAACPDTTFVSAAPVANSSFAFANSGCPSRFLTRFVAGSCLSTRTRERTGLTGLAGKGGSISGASLEASNTYIADEFTKLIVTQQAYSANTKVITTANTMVQDLLSVMR